jgi:hypothetical protein
MTAVRVYQSEAAIGTSPAVLVYRVSADTAVTVDAALRVYRAEIKSAGTANLGEAVLGIEPWTFVSLTATASGSPTGWTWRQISGPAVTLTGTGSTRSYAAPAPLNTTSLVFGVKATFADGTETAEGTVTHEVLWVTERAIINGVEVPIQILAV